jgi:glutamine amidotransferase
MSSVTVLDYGSGNLLSVCRAIEHCGGTVDVIDRPEPISLATRVVVPGVGAFADCMQAFRERGFDTALRDYARLQRPILGICVGMQILFDGSEEFGWHDGIGLINGAIRRIPAIDPQGQAHKIPHIGWSDLISNSGWNGTILAGVPEGAPAYFVHSYAAAPEDAATTLAHCRYANTDIVACVRRDNIYGCQFHPEKSGPTGLQILRNFLELGTAGA